MRFANPWALILLVLVPILAIVLGFAGRLRRKQLGRFAQPRFFDFYSQQLDSFKAGLRHWLLLVGFTFLIVASARPQWNREVQIVRREGIDIVVCVDVSKSMDASDLAPSRLERAKDQVTSFVDGLTGDRIALVAFAGRSFVQCPLTTDYGAAKLFLSLLNTDAVSALGTDIGGAIQKAYSLFADSNKHKVIVVISDGEDLQERALDTTQEIADKGVIVYTLGVGSPQGSRILEDPGATIPSYLKDESGEFVFTKLDEQTLVRLAAVGNGRYWRVTPRQGEIAEILKQISAMEKNKFDSHEFVQYKDQYKYFAIPALLFLLLETLIIWRRQGTNRRFL